MTADAVPKDPLQGKRLSPLTPFIRGSIFFVAAIGATWSDINGGELGWFALGLVGVLLAGLVYGLVSWLRTRYWIDEQELRVDTGVFFRQSRRIRIDRLQGIDIVQPFVARLFGLAELKFDTAGGGEEGSLAFLPLAEARKLKEVLLARRAAVRDEVVADTEARADETELAKLDLGMLIGSQLLTGEFLGFAVFGLGALGAVAFAGLGAIGGAVPALAGLGIVVMRRLAGYYNFTVSDTAAGLHVTRGLFGLTSQTLRLPRVQGVVVSEPLLWRQLGWARLDVSVAGAAASDDEGKLLSSTVLPVGPRDQVMALARHVLRGLDPDAVRLTPPPERSRWLDPIARHFTVAGLDDRLLVSRGGWWNRKTHAVPQRRVQSLRLDQGPWERRLGLANLRVDSPPGPVGVVFHHRDELEARALLEQAAELGRLDRATPAKGNSLAAPQERA